MAHIHTTEDTGGFGAGVIVGIVILLIVVVLAVLLLSGGLRFGGPATQPQQPPNTNVQVNPPANNPPNTNIQVNPPAGGNPPAVSTPSTGKP